MKIDTEKLTIVEARKHLDNADFSAVELAQAYLDKIAEKNEKLFAYLEVFTDVLEQAKRADALIKSGQAKTLTGIPLAVKDNILIKGRKASAASKSLENYVATYDAKVIEILKEQAVVFLGRTNMDEFAMGSSTETSAFGVARNPYDETLVPGGSSGGSAVVVSAGMAMFALGSDTGGSIRQPASFCGVVGLKPTYGAVSRSGVMALGSSLDQIGPFTKTIEDARIVFDVLAKYDKMDATSTKEEKREEIRFAYKENNKRIGIPRKLLESGKIKKENLDIFYQNLEELKKLGYTIEDIEIPHWEDAIATYYVILPAEASSNLARYDGIRYGLSKQADNLLDKYMQNKAAGYGKEVRRRIILGTYVLSAGYHDAYYKKALKVRALIRKEFRNVFDSGVDLIATPTTPGEAFKIGEKQDPISMYMEDLLTVPANLANITAISIPLGFNKDGLPLGFQLSAPHFCEEKLFEVGKLLES